MDKYSFIAIIVLVIIYFIIDIGIRFDKIKREDRLEKKKQDFWKSINENKKNEQKFAKE